MFDLIAIVVVGSVAYTGYRIYKGISESETIQDIKDYSNALIEIIKDKIDERDKK